MQNISVLWLNKPVTVSVHNSRIYISLYTMCYCVIPNLQKIDQFESHVTMKLGGTMILPLPWLSVHWNATGMPLVDPVYTGIPLGDPNEYLQGTLEHHWKNLVETAPHWNATGETLTIFAYTGTPLEKLSWHCLKLRRHWRNFNCCSLHWNTATYS